MIAKNLEISFLSKIKFLSLVLFFNSLIVLGCNESSSKPKQGLVLTQVNNFSLEFAIITPCAATTVNENNLFTCNQTGAVDDIWFFGSNHTCDWLEIEQEQGIIFGTPDYTDIGSCTLDIEVLSTDPTIISSEYTITINNIAPTLTLPVGNLIEDAPLSVVFNDAQVQADEEGTGVGFYSINDASTLGTPLCSSVGEFNIDTVKGTTSFKPIKDFFGMCFFSIEFDDGQSLPNSKVVTETEINISGVNDAPVISFQAPLNLLQNETLSTTINSFDADGDILTYALAASNTCAWATIAPATGVISGTPNDDQVGLCNLAVEAFDGALTSLVATETIEVFNLRPTLSITDTAIPVAQPLTVIRSDANVQADEEGFGVYAFDHATTPGDPCHLHGTLLINTLNGQISFDPDDTYSGLCSIKVTFNDQNPTRNIGFTIFTVQVGTGGGGGPLPTVAITSPVASDYINLSNQSSFDVSGTCSDVGFNVQVDVGPFTQIVSCSVGGVFTANFDLSSLLDSSGYLVQVTHENAFFNTATDSLSVPKDSTADDTMLFSLINPTQEEGYVSSVIIRVSGLPLDMDALSIYSDSSCSSLLTSTFTATTLPTEIEADVSLSGLTSCQSYTFYGRYTDLAGNQSSCSALFQNYYLFGNQRNISLAPSTTSANELVQVNLTTSNFDYTKIQPQGQDFRFFDSSNNKINYFIENLNLTGDSKLILNIPNSGTNNINMYYCQPDVVEGEDLLSTFTFANPKNLYVEMLATNETTGVASYIDSNLVTFTGAAAVNLNMNAFTNISNVNRGLISANGPLVARVLSANGRDVIAPFTFVGQEFGYTTSRSTDTWTIYNPNSLSANVQIQGYNSGGGLVYNTTTAVAGPGFSSINIGATSIVSRVSSNRNILAYYAGGTSDVTLAAPNSLELYGVVSNGAYVAVEQNNTNINIFYSNGATQTLTNQNIGTRITLTGPSGTQGGGVAARIVANKPVFAHSQADSDGSESMTFLPPNFFDKIYILPTVSQYVSIACPEVTTISAYSSAGVLLQTQTCTPPATGFPGKIFFGSSTVVTYAQGTRFEGDKKFFAYFEYDNQDETNILGPSHARPFSIWNYLTTLGAETSL